MTSVPEQQTKSLLDLITIVDNVPLDFEQNHSPYYRFFLAPDPRPHGFILPETVRRLPWPPSFTIDHDACSVTLSPPSDRPNSFSSQHANDALQQAVDAALASGAFPTLSGLHSEPFRLLGAPSPDVVRLERFAAPLFGIATRGAHMTAFVRDTSSSGSNIKIWVARRSAKLHTYPGLLDSTVAGGVKADDSPWDCILAEAEEEASLPHDLVSSRTIPTGVITLANRNARTGLFHSEVLYTYDLELSPPPPTTTPAGESNVSSSHVEEPRPQDGEVERFELLSCDEVRRRMEAGEFKPNVCAVMIDFLIRHGVVRPESEGEGLYAEICGRLRRRLPVPLGG